MFSPHVCYILEATLADSWDMWYGIYIGPFRFIVGFTKVTICTVLIEKGRFIRHEKCRTETNVLAGKSGRPQPTFACSTCTCDGTRVVGNRCRRHLARYGHRPAPSGLRVDGMGRRSVGT